jgi:hypothetical protein
MANEETSYILSHHVRLNDGCKYNWEVPEYFQEFVIYSRKFGNAKEISLRVYDNVISIYVPEKDGLTSFTIGNLINDIVHITKRETIDTSGNLVMLREKIYEIVLNISSNRPY